MRLTDSVVSLCTWVGRQKISGSIFLNFVVLAVLLMSSYRKLWSGGLNAFKMGAIVWKNVVTIQTRVIQGVPKLVIQN
jgi:hypothetical protein